MAQQCRWGILSTAVISQKNWRAIANAENALVAAVASRDRARAECFIERLQREVPLAQVPTAYGDYGQLLEDPEVDAVYLPLPTKLRKAWAIRAAEAGKHILLEKPCGVDAGELGEIIAACDNYGVQFMDGVMLMHSERLQQMREIIDAGTLGQLKRITTQVTFNGGDQFLAENIRVKHELEPLGALGDIGWYCARIILWAVNWQEPTRVSGRMISATNPQDSRPPVPLEFSGELFFEGDISAAFYCSFLTELQEWVSISGTAGSMFVDDFMLPEHGDQLDFVVYKPNYTIDGTRFEMELNKSCRVVNESGDGTPNSQETNMIRRFSDLVISGRREPEWAQYSLLTQRVLDACLTSARSNGQAVTLDGEPEP